MKKVILGEGDPCISKIKVYSTDINTGSRKLVCDHSNEDYGIEIEMDLSELAQGVALIGGKKPSDFFKTLFKENDDIINNDLFTIARLSLEACLKTLETSPEKLNMQATVGFLKDLEENYCY